MFDILKVVCAVTKITVADTEKNTKEVVKYIKEHSNSADVILFSELCLTGYTCGDLYFQSELLSSVLKSIDEIVCVSKASSSIIIIGAPMCFSARLYNCALVIFQGKIIGIVPKTFIPNYNEFYEKRWFASANELPLKSISSSDILSNSEDYKINIGSNLIFDFKNRFKFSVEICEDLWAPLPPSNFQTINGAEVVFNLSASNETISKRKYRKELIKQQSARCMCGYVYASSGDGESTTDLVFSGHSLICENGTVVNENSVPLTSNYSLVGNIDLGKIRADRLKIGTFNDCATVYSNAFTPEIVAFNPVKDELSGEYKKGEIEQYPFVPKAQTDRIERCLEIFEMQVSGLKKRLEVTGSKPVVGVSGGLDSTLALLVATEAVRRLNWPIESVVGITMPCFGTSDRTYNNSLLLMQSLGITYKEINIKEACLKHFSDIGHDKNVLNLTYENCQARERTQVLMDYAGEIGGFVVGTGDLSELALGWCTYNADHMSMYGVNVGVPKTLVKWMIDSISKSDIFPESVGVLKDVVDTPISPELLPPDEKGAISQQTEDIVGPYMLHDFFIYYVLRFGFSPSKLFYLACVAFEGDIDEETIKKWLKAFYKRFFTQQFKRSCLPDGVKIGSVSLSPRGDWRMPSDASANIWLKEIENL